MEAAQRSLEEAHQDVDIPLSIGGALWTTQTHPIWW